PPGPKGLFRNPFIAIAVLASGTHEYRASIGAGKERRSDFDRMCGFPASIENATIYDVDVEHHLVVVGAAAGDFPAVAIAQDLLDMDQPGAPCDGAGLALGNGLAD